MSSEGIHVNVAYVANVRVVTVSGDLDVISAPVLRDILEASSSDSSVVVNLGGVQFIDSSGLNVLVAQQRRFDHAGGSLELDNPSRAFQRLASTSPFAPDVPFDVPSATAIAPVVSLHEWVQLRPRRNRRSQGKVRNAEDVTRHVLRIREN